MTFAPFKACVLILARFAPDVERAPNEAVEKVSSSAHRAVNQNKYQGQSVD